MITYKFEYIQYQTLTNKGLIMKRILNQATIHIKMGMITAITGKSGSGKTSIMYRLGLIENTLGDRYFFNDQEIDLSNEDLKSDYRGRKISFVYQDNNLLNDLTLQDNFDIFNRMISNDIDYGYYLDLVGLDISLLSHKVESLSGGERQRATIALALMKQPELLILDEPTSALDYLNKENIIHILKTTVKHNQMAIVVITHDRELAASCDEIYEVKNQGLALIKESGQDGQYDCIKPDSITIPNNYINKTFLSNKKQYIFCILALTMMLVLSQITFYVGARFMKDRELAIGSLPCTSIMVVSNSADQEIVKDYIGNEVVSEDVFKELYSNEHICSVTPIRTMTYYIINPDSNLDQLRYTAILDGYLSDESNIYDFYTLLLINEENPLIRDILQQTNYSAKDIYLILGQYESNIADYFLGEIKELDSNEQIYTAMEESDYQYILQYASYARSHQLSYVEIYDLLYEHANDHYDEFLLEINRLGYTKDDLFTAIRKDILDTPFIQYYNNQYMNGKKVFYKTSIINTTDEYLKEHKIYLEEGAYGANSSALENMQNFYNVATLTFQCINFDLDYFENYVQQTATKEYLKNIYGETSAKYENFEFVDQGFYFNLSYLDLDDFGIRSILNVSDADQLFDNIDFPVYFYDQESVHHPYASSSYMIEVDSITNMEIVMKKLKSIDPDLGFRYDNAKLTVYQHLLLNMNVFFYMFIVILLGMIFVMFTLILSQFIKSKYIDIGLLKIYGLSEKKTFSLYMRILLYCSMILLMCSNIIYIIICMILKLNGFIPVIPFYWIIVWEILLLAVVIACSSLYLKKLLKECKMNILLKSK